MEYAIFDHNPFGGREAVPTSNNTISSDNYQMRAVFTSPSSQALLDDFGFWISKFSAQSTVSYDVILYGGANPVVIRDNAQDAGITNLALVRFENLGIPLEPNTVYSIAIKKDAGGSIGIGQKDPSTASAPGAPETYVDLVTYNGIIPTYNESAQIHTYNLVGYLTVQVPDPIISGGGAIGTIKSKSGRNSAAGRTIRSSRTSTQRANPYGISNQRANTPRNISAGVRKTRSLNNGQIN